MPTAAANLAVDIIFKDLVGQDVEIESIEEWGAGALNHCYRVTTRRPGGCFFLKIENEDIIPSTRRGQIVREVYGIQLMDAAGIPCPRVLAYDWTGTVAGCRYLVEEFIDARLFWELKEALTDSDWQALRGDVSALLAKMGCVTSPLYGDVYPGGQIVGQHPDWPSAYRRIAEVLLADWRALDAFPPPELALVEEALARGAERLVSRGPAGYYHGDLGLHNLMADTRDGAARLGKVIDFGNGMFYPAYANEHYTRLYGGFGLELVDVTARYGVQERELEANDLLFTCEQALFWVMLGRRGVWDPSAALAGFVSQCRQIVEAE